MDKFYAKYKCGKAVDLVAAGAEGTLFAGRRISQDRKFNIEVTMNHYVKDKLSKIEVPRGYIKDTKAVSDGMLTKIKGVNGALGWLSSTGRPDMAVHSIIPGGYEARQPTLITDVNAAVSQCQSTPITLKIWSIPPDDLRWTTFTDSGFDTSEKARHQQGWVVGATNQWFNQGRRAPVSVVHWRSCKLPRKAGSPQLVETYAASSAVVEMA